MSDLVLAVVALGAVMLALDWWLFGRHKRPRR